MAKHHHQRCTEPFCSKLDTANLGGRYNIACYPYDEQITQTLIKDDFCWHPGIRAAKDDGKGCLSFKNTGSLCLPYQRLNTAHPGDKSLVAFLQSL